MNQVAIMPVSDIERMASAIAKSGFFGMKTMEQAMALMFIAQAEGKHPATAAQEYHVIQGKPALKADAMMARFQAAGGKVEWLAYTDTEVKGKFSHPSGGTVDISWTFEMAKKANLTNKDTWKNYPRQMLRARVISEGIRTVYPGVAVGVYTPEEVQDFAPEMKDVTPVDTKPIDMKPYEVDETKPKSIFKNNDLRKEYQKNVTDSIHKSRTVAQLNEIITLEKEKFAVLRSSGDERDQMVVDSLNNIYRGCLIKLQGTSEGDDSTFDDEEVPAFIEQEMAAERDRMAGMKF